MYYTTAIPDIIVDISIGTRKDKRIVAKGIPKNKQTEENIEELGSVERSAGSAKKKVWLIRHVIEEIEERYREIHPTEKIDT